MDDTAFRKNIVELLEGSHAHASVKDALEGLKPENRHQKAGAGLHSIWEELEHLRLAQEDILRYTVDSSWKSPEFPKGYWPPEGTSTVTQAMWDASVKGFTSDLEELKKLAMDASIDLTSRIPHGEWRTYLREILLASDHNSYHLGQIVQTRKLLGDWK